MPHGRAGAALPAACSGGPISPGHRSRPLWRVLVALVTGGVAAAMLVPRADDLPAGFAALTDATPGWSSIAVVIAVLPYLGAAAALQGVVATRLPFGSLMRVQVAGAFATAIAPAGIANLALHARYLMRAGVVGRHAAAAVVVVRVTTSVVHVVILAALTPVLADHLDVSAGWPQGTVTLITVGVLLLVSAASVGQVRRWAAHRMAALIETIRPTPTSAMRLVLLIGGSAVVTLARAATMYACLRATGVPIPVVTAVALFLAAEAAGAVAATPAGIGVLDGVLLTGLVAMGEAGAPAVAAVLLFRMLTFWLPLIPGAFLLGRLRRAGSI